MANEVIIFVGPDMLGRDSPGLFTAGEEWAQFLAEYDGPSERNYFFYEGDLAWLDEYQVMREEALVEAIRRYKPPPAPSLGERIAAKLFCSACLLPKFVPGHKIRGCNTF